jgi:WD40 repeat protein
MRESLPNHASCEAQPKNSFSLSSSLEPAHLNSQVSKMAASTMQVHHCRFVEAQPSAVQCMAVSHDQSLLAVGRDNGSIEIWNIKNEFYYERVRIDSKMQKMLVFRICPEPLSLLGL